MAILTQFDRDFVLWCAYGNRETAAGNMRNSIRICWPARNRTPIARSRIRSAIRIIKDLQSVNDTNVVEIPKQVDMFMNSKEGKDNG